MATSTTISKLDMAEINSGIKAALALTNNEAACAALRPIAESLINGYGKGAQPECMTPALTVIEQIAARNDGNAAADLYVAACRNNFPHSIVRPSVFVSLGSLCQESPSTWNLGGIKTLIATTTMNASQDWTTLPSETKNQEIADLCCLAVDIATASAQAGNPQLENRAGLYAIATNIPLDDGLLAKAAGFARREAEKAFNAGSKDIRGISALLFTDIDLSQQRECRVGTGCAPTPSDVSEAVNTCFTQLERWRAKYTGEQAEFASENPTRKIIIDQLGTSYLRLCTLVRLPPQHAAQVDHAKQMATWLLDYDARGKAPVTAWSIAQENSVSSPTSVFERLRQLSRGGVANGNALQAKRPSSYALS